MKHKSNGYKDETLSSRNGITFDRADDRGFVPEYSRVRNHNRRYAILDADHKGSRRFRWSAGYDV